MPADAVDPPSSASAELDLVVDPDVDLHDPAQRREEWDVVLAVSAGGALGALARYGFGQALPHTGGDFPWSTLVVNASGCVAIGILMVALTRSPRPPRLVRPLLGVGCLGGYTTYSTFAADTVGLLDRHRTGTAAAYLVATVIGCATAVWLATAVTRALLDPAVGVTIAFVVLGALVGAPTRYLTDRAIQRRYAGRFPWGTLLVNVSASLVLGALLGAHQHVSSTVLALVGTGGCGALSTYSTFSYETLRLQQIGARSTALLYLFGTLGAGIGAAAAGWALAVALI